MAKDWALLTNHGAALLCIAEEPRARMRDIAKRLGITERAVQLIITDLVQARYVTARREGRRNVYEVHPERPFRRHLAGDHTVGEFLAVLSRSDAKASRAA